MRTLRLAATLACTLAVASPLAVRADDDWGEPSPPPAAGGWGEPAAPAGPAAAPAGPVRPRFAPRAFDLAGRRVECGVPEGWAAGPLKMDGGGGLGIGPPQKGPDEGVAVVVIVLPADPKAPKDGWELSKQLPDLVRRAGWQPALRGAGKEKEPDTERARIGGHDGARLRCARADDKGRRATAVFQVFETGGLRVVVAGQAPEGRFEALEATLLLAAHQVRIGGAPPEKPHRPVVLDPTPRPARPLEGWYSRYSSELSLNGFTNQFDLIENEDIYGFHAGGTVVVDHLPLAPEAFDFYLHAARRPMQVATYDFDGKTARVRFADGAERKLEIGGTPGEESLKIGGQVFRRVDVDLGALALVGSYTWESYTTTPGMTFGSTLSHQSRQTIVFRKDGTFEESGASSFSIHDPGFDAFGGGRDAPSKGRFTLGRGRVTLDYGEGRRVTRTLRVHSGKVGGSEPPKAILIGSLMYHRK